MANHLASNPEWKNALCDPVREEAQRRGAPYTLDEILALFPRTTGEPAFPKEAIETAVARLHTTPDIRLAHPFLEMAVKTGLAHIEATFQGDHPKYGAKGYSNAIHDSFPPVIIAATDALSAWALLGRATELFRYWMRHFVRADGTIAYYGPSVSEYGQLLHTGASLLERAGEGAWWSECFVPLDRIAGYLLRLCDQSHAEGALIPGCPEADERAKNRRYFHNNAWAAKGLARWASICEERRLSPAASPDVMHTTAQFLYDETLATIQATWPADADDWWLTAQVEPLERPASWTADADASYTNYRYHPELLSSGILPTDMANRLVESRLNGGGQFCGMTRFGDHLDDWPLADYLYGLWALDRKEDFLLSLYGHVAYHQAEEHWTAYEQVSFPPGREVAAYCLPCQLVAARTARLLVE